MIAKSTKVELSLRQRLALKNLSARKEITTPTTPVALSLAIAELKEYKDLEGVKLDGETL